MTLKLKCLLYLTICIGITAAIPAAPAEAQAAVSPAEAVASPTAEQVAASPTAEQVAASPTAGQVEASPTAGQAVASPTAGQAVASPTAGQAVASPTAGQAVASPTAGQAVASPTAGQAVASPTAGQAAASPTAGQAAASPTAGQAAASPTAGQAAASPTAGQAAASPTAGQVEASPTSASEGLDYDVVPVPSLSAEGFDGIIYISNGLTTDINHPPEIRPVLQSASKLDKNWDKNSGVFEINLPAQRLIYSPITALNTDYHDIREVADAARAGMKRAIKAGVKRPILVITKHKKFPNSGLVTLLGALEALYTSLQLREILPHMKKKVEKVGVWSNELNVAPLVNLAVKLEKGRVVARDIGGPDPERMTPIKVEEYVWSAFPPTTDVTVEVISSEEVFKKEYPLFAAVNRAASLIDRHKGRIIYLKYTAPSPQQTLILVGKGVTYDTGGADLKTGGIMVGMSRDKCGAGTVAGFLKMVSLLRPANVSVIGIMSMVRNSIGENAYVSDEVLVARSGRRVTVGNTDAEGRFAMADCLYHAKELAKKAINPRVMTIATLTGHAVSSVGPYTVVLDNGPARMMNNAVELQRAGDEIGDILEVSRIRREDFGGHTSKNEDEDVLQVAPRRTPRGHQGPAAFLILASGLDKHGLDSSQPIPYFHLDVAGSSGDFPGPPTAAPSLALAQKFLMLEAYK